MPGANSKSESNHNTVPCNKNTSVFRTIRKPDLKKGKAALVAEETERRRKAVDTYRVESERTTEQQKHSQWETQATHLAQKTGEKEEYRRRENEIRQKKEKLAQIAQETRQFLESRRMLSLEKQAALPNTEVLVDEAETRLDETVNDAQSKLAHLQQLSLPKLVGPRLSLIFIASFILLMLITVWFLLLGLAVIASAVGSLVLGGGIARFLYVAARRQVSSIYTPLTELFTRGEHLSRQVLAELAANSKRRREELRRSQQQESREIDEQLPSV